MAGASDLANAGPFAKGLQKGFQKAQGGKGIGLIFSSLFSLIGKALLTLFKSAPMEMSILSALTVGMPVLQGAITMGLTRMFGAMAAGGGLSGGIGGMGASIAGWMGAVGPALATLARLLPPVAAVLAGIVLLGGGAQNAMRQLSQIAGETAHAIGGSFGGLMDIIGTITAIIGDFGAGIGRLVNAIPGVNAEFDALKVVLAIVTAPLQALELGLRGLNLVLATLRMWLANWLGTAEEKKAAQEAQLSANVKTREAQGRQNAYNLSMQGPQVLTKAMNNAIYELNKSKTLKADRSAELKAFVTEARAQLKQPAPAAKPGAGAVPGTAATAAPVAIPPATLQPVVQAANAGATASKGTTAAVQGAKAAAAAAATRQSAQIATLVTATNANKSATMAMGSKIGSQTAYLNQVASNTAQTNAILRNLKIAAPAPAPKGVHTANARGLNSPPTLFTTSAAARSYESMMAPPGAKVMTATANSSEFGSSGGPVNLTQNVSIDGYGGDPEQLAIAVWSYTEKAISRMQSNSFA
jgi:hypothetical protein